jgi:hypothetical protein
VWRGKVWDIMCYADLGDSIPRIIAWNKQGTTAPLFLRKLSPIVLPCHSHMASQHTHTHTTTTTHTTHLQMTFRRW